MNRMNNKEDFLNYYKPFKNHLRRLKLDDAFYVIWSYIQNLQFQNNFPEDIQVIPEYNDLDYIQKSRYCPAWDLELLTKEVLINSSQSIGRETLKKANYFAGALNKLKQIEGEIGTHYINPENVLSELFRISHRQFSWQTRPNNEFITRYYKIFGTDKFKNIIKNKLGLSIQKIYLIGLMLI
ncbi:TPA: hypothetical protein DCZ39_02765 [Patescibacteria group bacterium]|nr:hypothetical protein [Candidatus Gracilibacteria bacterium]